MIDEEVFQKERGKTPSVLIAVGLVFLITIMGFGAIALTQKQKPQAPSPSKPSLPQEEFCGFSTYDSCSANSDCIVGGCSSQVCQSKNEEPAITTCEYRECYNAEKYGASCLCLNEQCQWQKAND